MKNAIITGPTGAIGAALVQYLSSMGVNVYAIVRPHSARLTNIGHAYNVQIVECEFDHLSELSSSLPQEIDVFYHIAWAGTRRDLRDDVTIQLKNISYTMNAVELARKLKCKVFIGAGSQAEYGNCDGVISPSTPADPITAYGMTKLFVGQISRNLCRQSGIRHIWARFFSVYGPCNGDDSMIISTITKLLNNEKPSCTPGEQIWDYLYSEDAARALYMLAQKGKDGKVYCVGFGSGKTIRDYITDIRNAIDCNLPVGFGDLPYGNGPMKLIADITELSEDTGFVPEYSFEEGILKTICWTRQNLQNGELIP